jgi:diguanylate cyclase (GGDEF)-like protein
MDEDRGPEDGADSSAPGTLARALDQSERVKGKVEECASDLSSVNTVLKQEIGGEVPLASIEEALETSEGVEAKVQECVDDLAEVNDALAGEIDERHLLEDRLSSTDAALTASRLLERRARHDSLHDAVTGLPNLTLFNDRLQSALIQAGRHAWRFAVVFIDLDDFKQVNDTHGHAAGDRLLQGVAKRLEGFVRTGDTVCRRSGDEFLLLMLEAKDADTVATFARKILATVAAPSDVMGMSLSVTPSIGIAIYPEDGQSAEELLRNADTAMYAAKRLRQGPLLYSQVPDPSTPPPAE